MKDNDFGYLYVFDCSYPALYEIELTKEDENLTTEEILKKRGLKEDNCHFMYSENELELSIIKA